MSAAHETAGVVRGRLSAAEDRRVIELAGRGLNSGQIAMRLNRDQATISYVMLRLGLRAPSLRQFAYTRKGRSVRSFTAAENAFIEEAALEHGPAEISRRLLERFGYLRTPSSISVQLRALAVLREGVG